MPHKIKKIILLSGDLISFYLSLYITLLIGYGHNLNNVILISHIIPFTSLLCIWILIFYISGLYNLNLSINNPYFSKLLLKSFAISLGFSVIFFYLSINTRISPKTNLIIFAVIFLIFIVIWRYFFNFILKSYLPKTRIAIIGWNDNTENIIKITEKRKHLGNKIIFVFDTRYNQKQNKYNIPIFNDPQMLEELIINKKINTIILSDENKEIQKIKSILFSCIKYKINFINLNDFYENITGKISLYTINKIWFIENLNESNKKWFTFFKRIMDITISIILLPFFVIAFPIIGIIIKIESKGDILFKQKRIGKNGKIFTILKFRTMKTQNNDFAPTSKSDVRITKFGSFLRKTRLDEIPQIINILKNEMSLVGPRPERPDLAENLRHSIPFYDERTLVLPGITGWDQISGEYHSPSVEDTIKKLQYDLFYIKNRSIYLDISIMLKTIATVLRKIGR